MRSQVLVPHVALAARFLQTSVNHLKVIGSSHRLLYLHHEPPVRRPGFVKLSLEPNDQLRQSLRRESTAAATLMALDIPVPEVITPYVEDELGRALVEIEYLDQPGTLLRHADAIREADSGLGPRAAVGLTKATGRIIPPSLASSVLKRTDNRNSSFAAFQARLRLRRDAVLSSSLVNSGALAVPAVALALLADEAEQLAEALEVELGNPVHEYFVHNDATPINMFFSAGGSGCQLLDLEYAGATPHLSLAYLTDFGNCYGRMWQNRAMQEAYLAQLRSCLPYPPATTERIVRLSAISGTLLLAGEVMDPGNPHQAAGAVLLSRLPDALKL